MSMTPAIVLMAAAVACVLVGRAWRRRRARLHYNRVERAAMPEELRDARLVLNEAYYDAPGPHPLQARLDQVFVTRADRIVLVESKTRNDPRPRRSEQVQLSAQRVVLERLRLPALRGATFASHGYVRVVGDAGTPRYRRVELLPTHVVEALQARDHALQAGATAWLADDPGRCRRCRTTEHCPAWTARRHTPLAAWWSPAQWQVLEVAEAALPGFAPLLRPTVPSRPRRTHDALSDPAGNARVLRERRPREVSSASRPVRH
jgi:CRISPR-associated exonuclease Cas4